jgi:predicted PurR-regulated permease PerM
LIITGAHDLHFYSEVLPLIYKTIGVLIAVHLIDSFVLQPYIYSSSVNAHPLEIFLVILLTGNIAGIVAMIFAVPAYSVLRIVITEFYQNPNRIESN